MSERLRRLPLLILGVLGTLGLGFVVGIAVQPEPQVRTVTPAACHMAIEKYDEMLTLSNDMLQVRSAAVQAAIDRDYEALERAGNATAEHIERLDEIEAGLLPAAEECERQ